MFYLFTQALSTLRDGLLCVLIVAALPIAVNLSALTTFYVEYLGLLALSGALG